MLAGLPGWGNHAAEATLFQLQSIVEVMQAVPAATHLALACMQCFSLLLKSSKQLSVPQLQQVLAALAGRQSGTADELTLVSAGSSSWTQTSVCCNLQHLST